MQVRAEQLNKILLKSPSSVQSQELHFFLRSDVCQNVTDRDAVGLSDPCETCVIAFSDCLKDYKFKKKKTSTGIVRLN